MHWYFLILAIAGNTMANFFAKTGLKKLEIKEFEWSLLMQILKEPYFYLAFGSIVFALYFYIIAIIKLPLNTAYPIMSGVVFILVTSLGVLIFAEQITYIKLLGIALIMIGIFLVSKF